MSALLEQQGQPHHICHFRLPRADREFFIDNLLVRIHFIIVMIRWTGLAPWKFESLSQVALHLPRALHPQREHESYHRSLSIQHGTHTTVKDIFWPWISGKSP